jgi:hypothetical protein
VGRRVDTTDDLGWAGLKVIPNGTMKLASLEISKNETFEFFLPDISDIVWEALLRIGEDVVSRKADFNSCLLNGRDDISFNRDSLDPSSDGKSAIFSGIGSSSNSNRCGRLRSKSSRR